VSAPLLDPFQLEALRDLVLALLAGALVGAEREAAEKPAGLRTHMLVAAGATLFVAIGDALVRGIDPGSATLRGDPIRILEALVTGVSFLGAGTILRRERRGAVEGLTTAASLLVTAAIGAAIALDQFLLAAGATAITFVVLRLLPRLEIPRSGAPGA
jgi:putative Mg2+ transporter-C (MgtC) family protein